MKIYILTGYYIDWNGAVNTITPEVFKTKEEGYKKMEAIWLEDQENLSEEYDSEFEDDHLAIYYNDDSMLEEILYEVEI